ncbi:TonB-dependent receptor domain-containing protein [Sphingomonas humi]|uniref:TonB-dependent receptor n=1 Tax=Sphingomonas humi TaxID=335630 RepID=A0ABP7SBP3_9SPHN
MNNKMLLSATALRTLAAGFAFTMSGVAMAQTAPATTAADGTVCDSKNPSYNPNSGVCDKPADVADANDPGQVTRRGADGNTAGAGQEVVVTGSRIRLPNLESIEPTTTVDFRQIRERNFTNVADALNELPNIRGSVTPAGAQGSFGQGVNFVNTYGLGSNRTLSLINGKRFVTSNPATNFGNASAGTQTDLNVVPDILLDRIDLVSIGGAPVYGSDAIAGVVNVILRSKYRGIEVQGTTGITEEGDNFRYNVSGLFGGDLFDGRLNLTAAISHDSVDGLVYNNRGFLRDNISGVTNVSSAVANGTSRLPGVGIAQDGRLNPLIGFNDTQTDGFPGTVQARNVGIPYLTSGGLITTSNIACTVANRAINPASCFGFASPGALFFDPSGNLKPFNQGVLFGSGTSASLVGGDGSGVFQFNNFSQITSDLKRTIGYGFLTFNLTDNIELFAEGTHFRSKANELVQQPTFNSNLFAGLSGELFFNTSSPFLTQQARDTLTARGVTSFGISRASTDIADLTGYNTTRINRGVFGTRGDFSLFGRDMNFEAYFNYGKTKTNEYNQDINAQNFINAVNVTTNAQGQIVCTTATTRTGGNGFAAPGGTPIADAACVPFNPLGFGRASAASRDYIVEDFVTKTMQRQWVGNINVGGSIFDLPGGPLGFNVGYEHRDEKAVFNPSDFQRAGRGRSVAIVGIAGQYNLDEYFGEVYAPIISPQNNIPAVYGLQAFGRIRKVDNTVNGSFTSWAAGGSYAPIKDIELRGNYTKSFRAPAITELFLPIVNAFSTVPDLCQPASINGGAAPAIRAANCAAFLTKYSGPTPDPASTATVSVQTGGNPGLGNETANAWTVGVILRPSFIPRLSATVDYINIDLLNPISSLTVAQVASGCFDNPDFNAADPFNGNAFCSLIKRNANGTVLNNGTPAVRTGFVNGKQVLYRGWQGTLNYSVPLRGLGVPGDFSIGSDFLLTKYRLSDITGVAPARSDGVSGDPAFAGQVRLRYANKFWGMNTTVNYTGEQLFSRLNRQVGVAGSGADAREIDKLNDYFIVSGGLFFDPTDKMRFTLAVTNVFNYVGQKYQGVILPASYVDLLGRRFSASARVRF